VLKGKKPTNKKRNSAFEQPAQSNYLSHLLPFSITAVRDRRKYHHVTLTLLFAIASLNISSNIINMIDVIEFIHAPLGFPSGIIR